MEAVILKKGKEKILKHRHHWIFSGAIESYPDNFVDGDLAAICTSEGRHLGVGFFNRNVSLAGRILCFGSQNIYDHIRMLVKEALHLRRPLLESTTTTALRLVNAEGDGLPGLVIDKYGPYLVMQTGALGMRKLLPFFIEEITSILEIQGIYDKSNSSSLKEEGIEAREQVLWGDIPEKVEIMEEGIKFLVSITKGQKTGFFLDHRDMRKYVREIAEGKKVLNAFCYTGGFTLASLKGRATLVDSVDLSPPALELCRENISLNDYQDSNIRLYQEDVFNFLEKRSCDYDLVILDPPAFAKKKKDIPAASKGYKRIFGLALKKMPKGSMLLTSSCSHFISESLFEEITRDAARQAQRPVRIIGKHRLAIDHPINLFHPEGAYLKSLVLQVG